MAEKEFNLLDEPWIRVIDKDCAISEVSLKTLFAHAHEYTDLCGELSTQDVAVLRVLLAVLHSAFSRFAPDGTEKPFSSPDDALDRWEELWRLKRFPEEVVGAYLEKWRDRFWLFHPERPFYQAPNAEIGTDYSVAKLNGMLSESNNKIRLFPMIGGRMKYGMPYSQAARWLIYVNAFDDTSAKASKEAKSKDEKPLSTGAGWLGKLGLINAAGENLFETLTLNLILLDHRDGSLWKKEKPLWERETAPFEERRKIPFPDNLSELYTLQSRRLILKSDGEKVNGYSLLGGDFFDKENSFVEPMTLWRKDAKSEVYTPRRHNAEKQFWREFSSIFPETDENHRRPGVLNWVSILKENECLPSDWRLDVHIASVQYGDKDFFVNNIFSDSLTMSGQLITGLARPWQALVARAVEESDEIAGKIRLLANRVNQAAGGEGESFASYAKAQYYYGIDAPFREWLGELPSEKGTDGEEIVWLKEAVRIAGELAQKIVAQAGAPSFIGREHKVKIGSSEKVEAFSSAKALNQFQTAMNEYRSKISEYEKITGGEKA